jgi:hypothetical protein
MAIEQVLVDWGQSATACSEFPLSVRLGARLAPWCLALLAALWTGGVGAALVPAWPLNDTGIDWWADDSQNRLPAPPTGYPRGQDASLGRDVTHDDDADGHAGFSFAKLDADGNPLAASATSWTCVRDNVTGLTWEAKTTDGGLRGFNWKYTWYNADAASNGGAAGTPNGGSCGGAIACDTQGFTDAVNQAGLCGQSDWRLPNVAELESIVDFSRTGPAIDIDYFPATPADWFWTSSPYASGSSNAWYVHFSYGAAHGSYHKGTAGYVRLVRGGEPLPADVRTDQSIIFGPAPTLIVGATGTVTATGGASGNPVIFTSQTTSVCTTSGTNGSTVTGVSAYTCTIAADQAGNASYHPAPQVTQSFPVAPAMTNVHREALLTPNGGEVWTYGQTRSIQWNAGALGGTTVDLLVLHDDPAGLLIPNPDWSVVRAKRWYRFATGIANSGTFAVDPRDLNGTGNAYLVLIVSSHTDWDLSDGTFTLTPGTHTVTPAAGAGGTVSPATAQTVNAGATTSFLVTAGSGYTRNAAVGGTCPQGSWSDNTWTTGAIDASCSVTFGFTGFCWDCLPRRGGWRAILPSN